MIKNKKGLEFKKQNLFFAFIACGWHSLIKFHRYEWFRDEIRLFGVIPVWWKYKYIQCVDCDKKFYKEKTK